MTHFSGLIDAIFQATLVNMYLNTPPRPTVIPPLTTSNGLPIGIQLAGNYKEDGKLLNVAKFIEQHLRGHPLRISNKDKIVIAQMV